MACNEKGGKKYLANKKLVALELPFYRRMGGWGGGVTCGTSS